MVNRGKQIEERIVFTFFEQSDIIVYQAKYDKLRLDFSGVTGNNANVRHIIRRMIEARVDPPEDALSIVPPLVGYIEIMTDKDAKLVSTTLKVDLGRDGQMLIGATVRYSDGKNDVDGLSGWVSTLGVKFIGFDGYSDDAEHEVSKTLRTKDFDSALLTSELRALIKMAYNAHARQRLRA